MERREFLKHSSLGLTAAGLSVVAQGSAASALPVANRAPDAADIKHAIEQFTTRLKPQVQHAREVALNLLKPTAAELERGYRLHAESVVFDSYGFSPRAAYDGEKLAAEMEAGASDIELQDLREEMSMTRSVTDPVEQQEYLDAWRVSGVTCIFQNAGEESQDPLVLLKRLARFTYVTDMLKDSVSKAAFPEEIRAAKQAGKHCLYLTGNGVPLTQQWVSTPDELRYLRIFFQLGIRMMHLTYQRRNMIGDGCGEPGNAGLSDFGRSVIAEMNRVGVIPDCAHSGWRTSLEAAQTSSKPCVASHSVCAALDPKPHARSKPDEVIQAIADTGGFIGICCISKFLKGTGDLPMLLNHVDYVAKKFGVEHVAIGTDIAASSSHVAAENKKVPRAPRGREPFRSLWPNDDFKTTREMTDSLAWTNWPLYTVGLVQRGYTDDQIRNILGGNVLRVTEAALA